MEEKIEYGEVMSIGGRCCLLKFNNSGGKMIGENEVYSSILQKCKAYFVGAKIKITFYDDGFNGRKIKLLNKNFKKESKKRPKNLEGVLIKV